MLTSTGFRSLKRLQYLDEDKQWLMTTLNLTFLSQLQYRI